MPENNNKMSFASIIFLIKEIYSKSYKPGHYNYKGLEYQVFRSDENFIDHRVCVSINREFREIELLCLANSNIDYDALTKSLIYPARSKQNVEIFDVNQVCFNSEDMAKDILRFIHSYNYKNKVDGELVVFDDNSYPFLRGRHAIICANGDSITAIMSNYVNEKPYYIPFMQALNNIRSGEENKTGSSIGCSYLFFFDMVCEILSKHDIEIEMNNGQVIFRFDKQKVKKYGE